MWEPSRADPQLLFDVSLEIAASWQRLPPGASVQRGQPFPRCLHEPPLEPGGFPPTPEKRGRSFGAGAGVSLARTATRSNHWHTEDATSVSCGARPAPSSPSAGLFPMLPLLRWLPRSSSRMIMGQNPALCRGEGLALRGTARLGMGRQPRMADRPIPASAGGGERKGARGKEGGILLGKPPGLLHQREGNPEQNAAGFHEPLAANPTGLFILAQESP